ncbi:MULTISPECIES: WYL domain-containing protein [Chromobacterium]|uniref:WYL domain-containing protein n=1 Tax=Chromobacterium TaxID=535 RepID=UPI001886DD3D|nr:MULTISPECIES: WYL domain-containing protein [Chromobacterium]QOZ84701.1 WYL domain-containing protein [Chromobacterium sp. Rain0013]WON84884.1 WYL domain-containing protein [Chromobacterium haemolyticum]
MSNKPALRDHRLRIMEGVLAWEGEIGNTRVRELFDIQPVQASRLLADFRALMSNRIVEDGRAKVLKPSDKEGLMTDIPLEDYVRHTSAFADPRPYIIDARVDLTEVKPVTFATLRSAVKNGTGVKIRYTSMSNPNQNDRVIFPHSIILIGRRWHVRAWCVTRHEFRDFTLGRILQASPVYDAAPFGRREDKAWNEIVSLKLFAHRKLSPEQQQVVRIEYFNGEEHRILPTRACLVQYVIQDLRVAINPEKELPPDFQLEISAKEPLINFLF